MRNIVLLSIIHCMIASMLLLTTGCSEPSAPKPTLEQQARQMIVAGFYGTKIGDDPIIAEELQKGLGGIILFDRDVATGSTLRNIESPRQVRNLIADLKKLSAQPLIVAVDQEGGRVCRLRDERGFYCMPSAQLLGNINNTDKTAGFASRNARMLKNAGFNLDFAPVVDLNVNPDNPVIGAIGRSYSEYPATVAAQAAAFIQAHKRAGIGCCLKHFPGHGSSMGDSHKGFVDITATWSEKELEPYKILIPQGNIDAIMTAHVFNKNLDPQYPATMSKAVITGLLREQLGFEGIIFSDDMQMGAIADNYGFDTAIIQAINAGVDILILSNNSPTRNDPLIISKAVEVIMTAVESGQIPQETIEQSYHRITQYKKSLHD